MHNPSLKDLVREFLIQKGFNLSDCLDAGTGFIPQLWEFTINDLPWTIGIMGNETFVAVYNRDRVDMLDFQKYDSAAPDFFTKIEDHIIRTSKGTSQ